jgi:tetratricopeptide (TPR) repeat protein
MINLARPIWFQRSGGFTTPAAPCDLIVGKSDDLCCRSHSELHGTLLRETRRQLHGRIAKVLEDYFPDTVQTQPKLIAHHCAQAGLNRKAIEYLGMAGQRSIERSSNPEAIGHLKRALEMLHSLPTDLEHAQVALKLEVMLAQAMIAGKGYSSPETMQVLLRAKKLITAETETSRRVTILYGMWACYYVGGEVDMQHVAATEFLSEAETHDDTAALCLAHRALGTTYFTMGEFSAARKHLERAQGLYDPDHHLRRSGFLAIQQWWEQP